MNARSNWSAPRIAFIVSVLGTLICTGIFIYSEWNFRQFKSSLGELPELTVSQQSAVQRDMIVTERSGRVAMSSVPIKSNRVENEATSKLTVAETEYEELWLPEEDMLILDPESDEPYPLDIETSELAVEQLLEENTYLYSRDDFPTFQELLEAAYGDSEDASIVAKGHDRAMTGTATKRDFINMLEAWLRILPEHEHANRQSIMEYLEKDRAYHDELRQHVESTPTIVTGREYIIKVSIE